MAVFAIFEDTRWRVVTVPTPLYLRAGGVAYAHGFREGQHLIRAYRLHGPR